jgi:predicted phosphodiesterase
MGTILVGDIHGSFDRFNKICRKNPSDLIIQLGDYGLFDNEKDRNRRGMRNSKFIRGNHDCPEVCRLKENYLGDYGIFLLDGIKIFFISGADSIDKNFRKEGIDWWRDEQLSYEELNKALALYEAEKPDVVLSHDAPARVCKALIGNKFIGGYGYESNATSQALDAMFEIHKPKQWFFGHHHLKFSQEIEGTHFNCLDIFETYRLT